MPTVPRAAAYELQHAKGLENNLGQARLSWNRPAQADAIIYFSLDVALLSSHMTLGGNYMNTCMMEATVILCKIGESWEIKNPHFHI